MIEIKVLASGSKGNCYRVTDGKTQLLLECGIPFKEIQKGLGFRVSEIAGCLITHEHQDHCKAVAEIIKAGIETYMSFGTIEALELEERGLCCHRVNVLKSKRQLTIGTWTILPFDTEHDSVEPLGFLLSNQVGEKLLYATDTYYIKYRFKGLTHIMLEVNYSLDILRGNVESGVVDSVLKTRMLRSHMNLENAKKLLKANDLSKVREIWLLHLSDGNSDEKRFKREIMELSGKMVFVA
jgi:phosphoribosyl 1,2-cyclic phosphodiesterase